MANIVKQTTGTALATGTSWVGNAVPATTDIAQWDATSLGVGLTGALNVSGAGGGILVNGASGAIGHSSGTISVGTGGITFGTTNNRTWTEASTGVISVGTSDQNWVIYNSLAAAAIDIRGSFQGSANISVSSAVPGTRSYMYSASTTSTYTGTITLNGDIAVGVDGAGAQWGTANTATLKFTGSNNQLYSGVAATLTAKLTFDGAAVQIGNASAALAASGAVNMGSVTPSTLTILAGGFTLSGAITGTAGFTKAGSGTLIVAPASGTNAGFNGAVTVSGGTIQAAGNLLSGITGGLSIGASGAYYVRNATADFTFPGPVSGSGTFITASNFPSTGITFPSGYLSSFTGTLKLNSSSGAGFQTNIVQGYEFPGTLLFTVTAGGAFSLTNRFYYLGSGAVYSGGVRLDSDNNTSTASVSSSVNEIYANGSGALAVGGLVQRTNSAATASAAMTLTLRGTSAGSVANNLSGNISNVGTNNATLAIIKNDANKWIISGNNTYTGATTVTLGELVAGSNGAFTNSTVNYNAGTLTIDPAVTAPVFGSLASASTTVNLAIPTGANLSIGGNGASSLYAGILSGLGSMTKAGAGTQTLTGTNTFTGTITVSAGTLSIGNASASGTMGLSDGAAVTINGGTLNFNRNDSPIYSNSLSGAGGISKTSGAASTFTKLTGNNSGLTGAVTVTSGALRAAHANAVGSGAGSISVASGASFELEGGIALNSSRGATIIGTGLGGLGALRNVSGNNSIGGVVALGAAATIGSDAGTLSLTSASAITGATFALSLIGAGDIDITPAINTTTGTVTKTSGVGAGILRGTSSYTGVTTVTAGRLGYVSSIAPSTAGNFGNAASAVVVNASAGLRYYGNSASTFSRSISFLGGAGNGNYLESNGLGPVTHTVAPTHATANVNKTLLLSGTGTAANTIGYVLANNGTGAISLTKTDSGKWILSQNNTATGAYAISGGTAVLQGTNTPSGVTVASPSTVLQLQSASGASRTGTATVTVNAQAKIQPLANSGQLGRHTYANLTFSANGRIRIGGYATPGVLYVNGNMTISGATIWNFSDEGFKAAGTYRVVQFGTGASLVGEQATLDTYVTPNAVVPAGRTVTSLTYTGPSGNDGAYITLVLA